MENIVDVNVFRLERLVERAYARMVLVGTLGAMNRHYRLLSALNRLLGVCL